MKKATLKRKGKRKIIIHLDGEPVTLKKKLKVRVVPQAVQVMVPAVPRRKRPKFLIEGIRPIGGRTVG